MKIIKIQKCNFIKTITLIELYKTLVIDEFFVCSTFPSYKT